jgi:anti-sigma regulatory factor (Ser/Thr protein kinase)
MGTSQRAGRFRPIRPDQASACAWRLPADASCARRARALVDELFTAAGAPRERVCDAKVMVSELATNALRHAADGPYELWFDLEPGEAVVAIFDALPMAGLSGDVTFSGDHGRGLVIVKDLSGGRWGLEPAPSRLHPAVSGKAVWFACPRF